MKVRSVADTGNRAAELHGGQYPMQDLASHVIDGPGPFGALQRSRPVEIDLVTQADGARAQTIQIRGFLSLAGERNHFVVTASEHVDGKATDPAGRTGNQDRPLVGR